MSQTHDFTLPVKEPRGEGCAVRLQLALLVCGKNSCQTIRARRSLHSRQTNEHLGGFHSGIHGERIVRFREAHACLSKRRIFERIRRRAKPVGEPARGMWSTRHRATRICPRRSDGARRRSTGKPCPLHRRPVRSVRDATGATHGWFCGDVRCADARRRNSWSGYTDQQRRLRSSSRPMSAPPPAPRMVPVARSP